MIVDSTFTSNCPPGFIFNATTHECDSCQADQLCKTCSAVDTCTECFDGSTDAVCANPPAIDICEKGTYLVETECIDCPENCLLCSSPAVAGDAPVCEACRLPFVLLTEGDVTTCLCDETMGFFLDTTDNICRSCETDNCKICPEGEDVCQQCHLGYFLGEDKMCHRIHQEQDADFNFGFNSHSQLYTSCHDNFDECFFTAMGQQAISCPPGLRLWNYTDGDGMTHSVCACNGAHNELTTSDMTCAHTEIPGCNFAVDGVCLICFVGTPTDGACDTADRCHHAMQLLAATGDECSDDHTCDPTCHYCTAVDDASACVTCHDPTMVSVDGTCACAPGFFVDGESCNRCHPKCKTCTDGVDCTECFEGFTLNDDSVCVPDYVPVQSRAICATGKFFNTLSNSCDDCSESCTECEGSADNCTACDSTAHFALYMDSDAGHHVCQCKIGTYYNNNTEMCIACEVTDCLKCSTKNLCDICSDNQTTGITIPNACPADFTTTKLCPDGYFSDSTKEGVCMKCDPLCKTCQGTSSTCTSCHLNSILTTAGECACADYHGLNGTADDSTPSQCVPCAEGVKSCVYHGEDNTYTDIVCLTGFASVEGRFPELTTEVVEVCIPSNIESGCPSHQFKDPNTGICTNCSGDCGTCVFNADNCATCDEGFQLTASGSYATCEAMTHYTDDQHLCPAGCTECVTNGDNVVCTTCKDTSAPVEGRCVVTYPMCAVEHTFWNASDNCEECDASCRTCMNSATECHSCYGTALLHNNTCVPSGNQINSEFYRNQIFTCVEGCRACTDRYTCTECFSGYSLENNVCTTIQIAPVTNFPVDAGKFYEWESQLSKSCHASCKTCLGRSKYCTSCPEGWIKYHVPNVPNYENASMCRQCPLNAWWNGSECVVVADCGLTAPDSENILACPDFTTGDCSGQNPYAPAGLFQDTDGVIGQCHATCLTCNGPEATHCTSCFGNKSLNLSTFTCEASFGFHAVGSAKLETVQCHIDGCIDCSANVSNCEQCAYGFKMMPHPTNPQTHICQEIMIPIPSSEVNVPQTLGECIDLTNVTGEATSYWDSSIKQCTTTCDVANCDQCFQNANNCFTCATGFHRTMTDGNYVCVETIVPADGCLFKNESGLCQVCLDGTFLRGSTDCTGAIQSVSTCSPNCASCGLEPHICLTCHDQYIWNADYTCTCASGNYIDSQNNKCKSCNEDFCQTCGNDGSCMKCQPGFKLYTDSLTETTECKPDIACNAGQFFNSHDQSCTDCNCGGRNCIGSADNCIDVITTCQIANQVQLADGSCACRQGYHLSGDSCVACAANCGKCTLTGGNCDTCINGEEFATVSSCPAPTCGSTQFVDFQGASQCKDCDASCGTCFQSATKCTSCSMPGANLNVSTGECTCPAHTIMSEEAGACLTCPDSCTECTLNDSGNGVQCSGCQDGYVLSPNGLCTKEVLYCDRQCETCNDTTFVEIEVRRLHCTKCHAVDSVPQFIVTERADLSTQCGICHTTLEDLQADITDKGETFDSEVDHIFYQLDTEPEFCRSCLPGCLTCDALNTCLTCQEGFNQRSSDGTCVKAISQVAGKCSVGYYIDQDDTTKCFPCHHSCESCTGKNENQCLACKKGDDAVLTNLYKNQCTCQPGNWYDVEKKECTPCDGSCMFCTGPGDNQCTRCAVPGQKPYLPTSDDISGKCYPCSTERERYPNECPDGAVFKFALAAAEPSSIVETDADEPVVTTPGVPDRIQPSPGFKTVVPSLLGEMIAKDNDLIDNIFLVSIPGLVEEEDFKTKTKFNEKTNEFDLRIIFLVDTSELEATVTIRDPSVFENFSPEPEADQFNQQALQDFRNSQKNARILSSVGSINVSLSNRITQTADENAPVLEQFEESFPVEGRAFPSEGKRSFYDSMGSITKILIIGALILGFVFGLLKLGLASVSNYEFFILALIFRFVTKLPYVNANFGNLLSIYMDQLFRIELSTMFDISPEDDLRSASGKFAEYVVPVLMINTIVIQASLYLITFCLNYVSIYVKKTKIFEYMHLLVVSLTWIDILLYTLVNIFQQKINEGAWYWFITSCIFFLMLTFDLGHFFVLNIFSAKNKNPEPGLRRSKSKIVESLELNHPYQDLAELYLNAETLKQYPHVNFVNVGLVLKLVLFTIFISLFQSSPRVMTWLIAGIQIFSMIAILFFQARHSIFKNNFILVFRLIEELSLSGIAILLVTFASDPENMNFKSQTTELLQLLTMIAILTLLIAELVVYLRYILSAQKEDTEKRMKAYEEVKRINTNKKIEANARVQYKVKDDDEFVAPDGNKSAVSNKMEVMASRKIGKKSKIINGNSPSASQFDDDKSYKVVDDEVEASASNNKMYKFKTNQQIEEEKSYKVEDDAVEAESRNVNVYKFKSGSGSVS